MISIDDMLGIIATEAAESGPEPASTKGESFQYDLELIQHEDGTLEWVE